MFDSIYSEQLSQYYGLRRETLSESAEKHELCYLRHFDSYVSERLDSPGHITEDFINEWVGSLSGKSSSVENKIIVIRQFLEFLKHTGESVAMPSIPRVHDDYVPYIFSDTELNCIFESADNIVQKDPKADPYLVIEFPVILRLLYSCGLRIGETVKISMNDVDLDGGILRLIDTKGNKQRLVPMSAPMTDILYKYCLAMNLIGRNNIWLFPCNFYEDPISYYSIITCIWQAQHSKREYFSVLSHDIFLYRRLCLYVHIQPGFERYVDAVIEYRDLLYQFPDKDVIYLITSRHPYTHTRLCGPVHHGL